MNHIKKNFGFGCMRLPMNGDKVDLPQTKQMVDLFLQSGFNYFDTAHGYIGGQSETALNTCLTQRYPRESYVLTNKLTGYCFNTEEEILPLFQKQLAACGVSYFDFYLMHAQTAEAFQKFKRCRAYEIALELKKQGKILHFGISFHDTAEVLEQILTEYPQIETVQIQYNYLDEEDPAVQSGKCLAVCRRFSKPAIVMEPVKGGSLANLPDDASALLTACSGGSPASYAIRYAAGADGVFMTLSGMSNLEQMRDNLSFMQAFRPLNEEEHAAVRAVCALLKNQHLIPCTACRYCVDGCPQKILIPDLFACMNAKKQFQNWNADFYYSQVHTKDNGKASDCIKCGKCEHICPQHLSIRDLLCDVAAEFEH